MKTLKSNFKMIAMCYRGSKAWVILNALDILINPIRNLTIDVLLIGLIYNMISEGRPFRTLMPVFGALIVFYIGTAVYEGFLHAKVEPNGSIKIQRHIDRLLCENAADVELSMFDNAKFYEEKVFTVENCTRIAKKAVTNTASFFAYLIGGLMSMGLITGIEPMMLIFIAISILFSLLISKRQKKVELALNEKRSKLLARENYVQRVFYGREYAKELRAYPELAEMNLSLFTEVEKGNKRLTKAYGLKKLACNLLSLLNSRVLMYWLVMLLTVLLIQYRGDIEPGNLLIMTVSIATAALLIRAITNTIPEMANIRSYQEKFSDFLSYAKKRHESMGSVKIDKVETIEFKDVSFTYPMEEAPVLHHISFQTRADEMLVIVGLNGSGKSTILKLLMGFYPPDSGRILINGIDMRELDMDSYLAAVSCVFQDVVPYALPVETNITAEKSAPEGDRLRKVLADTCLSDALDREALQKDLTKQFSKDGVVLSGGTLQKLALARAFYKNASLVILDETTSAIDPESEMQIIESMERMKKGRILVQISHKLSNVKNSSQILYLENGQIVESGTHHELVEKKGKYYELFLYQSEKFEREQRKHKLKSEEWA